MSTQYTDFHRRLLIALQEAAHTALPADLQQPEDRELLEQLDTLAHSEAFDETFIATGQEALCRIVAAYPLLTPQVPRDLFWLFGGDCLHFMPDEEIERFQQLDERRFEAEYDNTVFDYEQERARALGLH